MAFALYGLHPKLQNHPGLLYGEANKARKRMIIESRDENTGITRHEYNTVNPELCRKDLEARISITNKIVEGRNIRYSGVYLNAPLDILSTPTRTIFFCPNRFALTELSKKLNLKEWEYDDTKRYEYVGKSRRA